MLQIVPKIHWFKHDCENVNPQDNFTDVPGLVTCRLCRRHLERVERARRLASIVSRNREAEAKICEC